MNGKDYYEAKIDIEKYKDTDKNVTFFDIFNPNTEYISNQDKNARLSICHSCDRYIKLTSQCRECGCFMNIKTGMKNALCPLKKW
jgi:hypothetical protein